MGWEPIRYENGEVHFGTLGDILYVGYCVLIASTIMASGVYYARHPESLEMAVQEMGYCSRSDDFDPVIK